MAVTRNEVAIDALRQLKRVRLAHLPTPVEQLDRLTTLLKGPRLWVKRDDCTGLATGGNKTRKIEFLLADALAKGADTLVDVPLRFGWEWTTRSKRFALSADVAVTPALRSDKALFIGALLELELAVFITGRP